MTCPNPACESHEVDWPAVCEECCTLDCCVPVDDGTHDGLQDTTNSRVDRHTRLVKHLRCSFCPPNRGENATRKPKHGTKKESKR